MSKEAYYTGERDLLLSKEAYKYSWHTWFQGRRTLGAQKVSKETYYSSERDCNRAKEAYNYLA